MRRRLPSVRPREAALEEAVARFLAAEASSRECDADEALAVLLGALPAPRPSRAFAARVTRIAFAVQPVSAAWRWLAAAGGAATALAAAVVTAVVALGLFDPWSRLASLAGGLVSLSARLDDALWLIRLLLELRDALVAVVAGTPAGSVLLAAAFLSGLALRRLTLHPASDRSPRYV